MSKPRLRLYLDLGLFVSFVLINVPQVTGFTFHEWASFIFIPFIIIHILIDWYWIVSLTQQLFKKLPGEMRFNHAWDYLNFALMTTVIVSGIIISQKTLPIFGIPINNDPFWLALHHISSALLLATIGIHIGMHWKWVANAANRYLFRRNQPANPMNPAELN